MAAASGYFYQGSLHQSPLLPLDEDDYVSWIAGDHHHHDDEGRMLIVGYEDAESHNYTVVHTVHIRVTPLHNYFVSWYILWACFVATFLLAAWQVAIEYRRLRSAGYHSWFGGGGDGSHHHPHDGHHGGGGPPTSSSERGGHGGGGGGTDHHNGSTVSIAEVTRCMFRRFLLVAMLARAALMPVQIWSNPMWWQFFGDTLPEILFASAWTLLVTFFVQLQGILAGTLTDPTPGMVIQAMTFIVYGGLIVTDLFNTMASILLYTLLCGIYATLLGILLAFGPRWLWQLPDLPHGVAVRLTVCNVVACLVFALHAFSYARLVIAPPKLVFWWYRYGVLELFPAAVFLLLMQPTAPNRPKHHQLLRRPLQSNNSGILSEMETGGGGVGGVGSKHSVGGGSSSGGGRSGKRRPQPPETIPLVKKSESYGASMGDS